MVLYEDPELDVVFGALAHPARRSTLEALADGARSVSELAAPHGMSLAGFTKHLRVLEAARLIACEKEGRVVRCVLAPERMRQAAAWLAHYEQFWDVRLDALGRYLYHRKEIDSWPRKKKPASAPRSASRATTTPRPRKSGARGPTRKR